MNCDEDKVVGDMMKYGSTNVIVEEFSWICTFPFRICSIILKICENVFMVK